MTSIFILYAYHSKFNLEKKTYYFQIEANNRQQSIDDLREFKAIGAYIVSRFQSPSKEKEQ